MPLDISSMPEVILAVKQPVELPDRLDSLRGRWVFLLGGPASEVIGAVKLLGTVGVTVFVHLDMVHGIANDAEGIRLLVGPSRPDGIISTHPSTISAAKRAGLATVQRIFLLDSASLETGLRNVARTEPDAVEALPGVLPEYLARIAAHLSAPLITGGFVTTRAHVEAALAAGAMAVSTSTWSLVEAPSRRGVAAS